MEKSIIFSWLWTEIVCVMGVSARINIIIVLMNIRKIFFLVLLVFVCFVFCWYGNEEYWLNGSVWKSIVVGKSFP